MRRIFSTVFGPHEPALTVGSLAISATGRPSISPDAGDDAVGAEAVLVPVGQQRLLGEGAVVEQQRDALAHRQLALLARLLAVTLGTAAERALGGVARVRSRSRQPSIPVASAPPAREAAVRGAPAAALRRRRGRTPGRTAASESRIDGQHRDADHPGRPEARRDARRLSSQTPTLSAETPSAPPASCSRRRRSWPLRLTQRELAPTRADRQVGAQRVEIGRAWWRCRRRRCAPRAPPR